MRKPLKQLNEIFEPDLRSTMLSRLDATVHRPKTIDEHYADISAVRLGEGVPEVIRDEFDTIRNLYLYSWYVYDFTVPASLYAHSLIEKTIKEKCVRSGVSLKQYRGLKQLLTVSIAQGWLTNSAFGFALELMHEEIVPPASESELPTLRSIPRYLPTDKDYCEHLAETLPRVRNMGAHGEAGLGFPASALSFIEICACVANALFPDPDDSPEYTGAQGLTGAISRKPGL